MMVSSNLHIIYEITLKTICSADLFFLLLNSTLLGAQNNAGTGQKPVAAVTNRRPLTGYRCDKKQRVQPGMGWTSFIKKTPITIAWEGRAGE